MYQPTLVSRRVLRRMTGDGSKELLPRPLDLAVVSTSSHVMIVVARSSVDLCGQASKVHPCRAKSIPPMSPLSFANQVRR
jgi:hypothetical protein